MQTRAKRQRCGKEKQTGARDKGPPSVYDGCANVSSKANADRDQAARANSAEPADQSDAAEESYPKPTAYLYDLEVMWRSKLVELPDLNLATRLTAEEYREARSSPMQCNLQLKVARVGAAELRTHAAVLPAIDACRLSPVLNTRLQRWLKPTAGGRAEMALQVAVSQEIVDTVVKAVYNRKLLVNSKNAESLLLLADYLQMSWLTDAVTGFAKELLQLKPSPGVSKLATAYPSLGIFPRAVLELMAAVPGSEALVEIVAIANQSQRDCILRAAAQFLTSAQRLDLLLGLSRHPDVNLLRDEAMTLHQPSSMPTQSCFGELSKAAEFARLKGWAELYMQRGKAAEVEAFEAANFLVWDVPLDKAKLGTAYSEATLNSADGRKFRLATDREEQRVGIYIQAVKGSLKGGDRFRIFPVGSLGSLHDTEVPAGEVIKSWGYPDLVTILAQKSSNTIFKGKALPVALQML